jgi:Piwi domain
VTNPTLLLNGFRIELSSERFRAWTWSLPETSTIAELRAQHPEWSLWASGDAVLAVPATDLSDYPRGDEIELQCREELTFISYLVNAALSRHIQGYDPYRMRPYTFLAKKQELVAAALRSVGIAPTRLLAGFQVRPRYALEVRLTELRNDQPFLGLFVDIATRRMVTADLEELAEAGIALAGLHVIHREPEPGRPMLVGRIESVAGGTVRLSDSFSGEDSVAAAVTLEGSSAVFRRCLSHVLGSHYESFEQARMREEDQVLTGPARERQTREMGVFLTRNSPLMIAPGLQCTIGERIAITNAPDYRTVVRAHPVEYCFDAAKTKRSEYAWAGIESHGPFSRETFPRKSPRIAVVFPDTVQGPVEAFLRALRDGIQPRRGRPAFGGGFAKTYGLTNPEFLLVQVPWLRAGDRPFAALYREAIERFIERQESVDAAIVVLLDEHADLPGVDSPYLNAKAWLLMAGIPSQEMRLSKIRQPPEGLQWILQNVTLALYAKMGGVPWTVDHDLTINDEIVIGIGNAELSGSRFEPRQRFVGITTVFRGDGNYLLNNISRECAYADYAEMLHASTLQVLREIRERNGWRAGDTVRIVCHSAKPVRNIEVGRIVADCVKELAGEQTIEFAFLTVGSEHPFTISDRAQPGLEARNTTARKGQYAPERGTIVQVGRYQRLLAVNGPRLIKRPGAPLPDPLLTRLHPASDFRDLTYLTEQVLKFTSLSWRSTLPVHQPVTIYYSELIATLLARFRELPDWSPAMLNTKLRASRWFL